MLIYLHSMYEVDGGPIAVLLVYLLSIHTTGQAKQIAYIVFTHR